jgi:hypothetical protein
VSAKTFPGLAHGFAQRLRLFQAQRHRLVADDVKPFLKKVVATGACKKFGVTMETKSIRSSADKRGFAFGHFRRSWHRRVWGSGKAVGRSFGVFRVGGKTTGDQFNLAVEIRGHAMNRADESALCRRRPCRNEVCVS